MVNFDGIKGKIFLTLLLPAWTAILILIHVSFLPIHNICNYLVTDIYSSLIDRNNQIGYQIQQIRVDYLNVLKNAEADLLLLVNSTLNTYFNNSTAFKSDFKLKAVTHNAVEIMNENVEARNWNSTCNCSYTDAEWYISPNETEYDHLSQQAKDDIRLAASIHSLMRPFNNWVDFMNGYIWIFEETGVLYISPVRKYDFFSNYTEPESCPYDRSHLEPRCKIWHNITKNSIHDIVLTWPDFYEEFDIMGEFICLKVNRDSKFYASVCLQPRLKYLEKTDNYLLGDCKFEVYITRPDGYVVSKPNLWTRDYKPCILDLEFGQTSSTERTFFEKVYKPRFYKREIGNGIYATESSTNIIFHGPINLTLHNINNYNKYFYGAILYTTEIDDVLNYTLDIKSLYQALLEYEGLFWTFIMILFLILYWIITLRLVKSIVKPVDDLFFKIQQLNEGNYEIKFKENKIAYCKEVQELYEVFEMLKFVFVLDEVRYFEKDDEAMENYMIGFSMFKKFNNSHGAEVCLLHIAMLYMKKNEFKSAEKKLSKIDINRNCGLIQMIKKYLAICYFENEKIIEGKSLINEICNDYEREGNWAGWIENALIECEYCSEYDFPTGEILDIIQHLLKNTEDNDLLFQKYYYCRGLDFINQSKHKLALKSLCSSLVTIT